MHEILSDPFMVIVILAASAMVIYATVDMTRESFKKCGGNGGVRKPTAPDELPLEEETIVFPPNGKIYCLLKPKGGDRKLALSADATLVVKGRKEGYVLLVCTRNSCGPRPYFPVDGEAVVTEEELDELKRFAKRHWAKADAEQRRRRAEQMF